MKSLIGQMAIMGLSSGIGMRILIILSGCELVCDSLKSAGLIGTSKGVRLAVAQYCSIVLQPIRLLSLLGGLKED